MKKIFFIFILISNNLFSQTLSDTLNNNENYIFENQIFQESTISPEQNYESQYFTGINKLNLNQCDSISMESIGILSSKQIHDILTYRVESGNFKSLYELQNINSLPIDKIKLLLLYILPLNEFDNSTSNQFVSVRFSIPDSMPTNYLGQKYAWQFRTQLELSRKIQLNCIIENDVGEKYKFAPSKNYYGADFLTLAVSIKPKKIVNNFIIGDYRLQFGLGMIMGGAFQMGKSANIINIISRAQWGLMPNKSSMETGFGRGLAFFKQYKNFELIYGISVNKQDASLKSDTINTSNNQINSLYSSGLHRTENEIFNKANRNEVFNALNIKYKFSNFKIGLSTVFFQWDKTVTTKSKLYQVTSQYSSNNLLLNSLYLNKNIGNGILQFEIASMNNFKATSYIGNLIYPLNKNLDVALVFRNYNPAFYSPYANSFSDNLKQQNEKGLLFGFNYKLNSKNSLSGYIDKYLSFAPKYLIDFSSEGSDFLIKYQNDFKKNNFIIFQFRGNFFDKKSSLTNGNELFTYSKEKRYQLVSRFKFTNTNNKHSFSGGIIQNLQYVQTSTAIWQDVILKFQLMHLTIRNVFFDINNYDLRIYIPENDVPLLFSVPMLYGKGHRLAINTKFKISKNTNLYIKGIREVINNKPITWEFRTQVNWNID